MSLAESPTPRHRGARPPVDPARLCARMERAVERLIAAMDALDAPIEDLEEDADVEEDTDLEPSLGSVGSLSEFASQEGWARGGDNGDLETNIEDDPQMDTAEIDEKGDGGGPAIADAEPSLGSTHSMDQRQAWQPPHTWFDDAEAEHDGREPDADREIDLAEWGIGDMDGLVEQGGARPAYAE